MFPFRLTSIVIFSCFHFQLSFSHTSLSFFIQSVRRWVAGDWGECSVDCGIGTQIQNMKCIEKSSRGQVEVKDDLCVRYVGVKAVTERSCRGDGDNCPYWATGAWNMVSARMVDIFLEVM